MARKRTIDPDFWSDEKVLELSWPAVGFYIGLISQADDEGRLEWSARQLAARITGSRDDVSSVHIRAWMDEIAAVGLVVLYPANGKTYAYHPAWHKHQYINRKQESKLPQPPITGPVDDADGGFGTADEANAPERSRTTHGIRPEHSLSDICAITEAHVPLVSVSGSVLESGAPAGAGEPRRGEPCICEVLKLAPGEHKPEEVADLFLAVFSNRRSKKTRASALANCVGWLREMRSKYAWPQIWSAFAQAHRDGKHAPLHGTSAVWSNLRATAGYGATPQRPGLKVVTAAELEDAI